MKRNAPVKLAGQASDPGRNRARIGPMFAGCALAVLSGMAPVHAQGTGLTRPAEVGEAAVARTQQTATNCWTPGASSDLFSWTGTPGIACRDAAETSTPVLPPRGVAGPQANTPAADKTSTTFSFSGSAYAGVAVAF